MDVQNYSTILTALSIAGGLAIGVERAIEFLKHLMEMETASQQNRDKLDVVKRAKRLLDQYKKISSEIKSGTITNSFPSRRCEFNSIDDIIKSTSDIQEAKGEFADSEGDEKFTAPVFIPRTHCTV